jgi:hypothetical protein
LPGFQALAGDEIEFRENRSAGRHQPVGVTGLRLVGVSGVEAAPALAQRQIGLERHPVLVVEGERLGGFVRTSQIGERQRALVVPLFGLGVDREDAIGSGERARRIAGQTARARPARRRPDPAGAAGKDAANASAGSKR